ncbi:four-carbon acid sugar kinase family protein [Paenibacillus sp. CAU 1782]
MLKLLVIADDFTGALDTGVQFANLGVKTLVTADLDIDYETLEDDLDVLVMDTESRYLSFNDSYATISMIIEQSKKVQIPFIYKKVDSALRGNISSEIKAVLDHFPNKKIPFIPAYPEINRIVHDGNLYIDGGLVSESVFGSDPYEPVTESNIPKRLQAEANVEVQLTHHDQIDRANEGLLLFDSETDEDLLQIITALKENNCLDITIGCAGFAKVLAGSIFSNPLTSEEPIQSPLIVICGSINPITRGQVEYAESKKCKRYSLTPRQLLEAGYWVSEEGQDNLDSYLEAVLGNELLIFETLSDYTMNNLTGYGKSKDILPSEFRFRIAESLGNLSKQLLNRNANRTLLFTGGDTLFHSMQVLEINEIKPLCEISQGVVLSQIVWQDRPIQVITKSGGFGNKELFVDINNKIREQEGQRC